MGRKRAEPRKARSPLGYFIFLSIVTLLLLTNAVTGLALYYAPEINTLFREDNSAIFNAYEQRLTALRLEIDRLHSRQYAQMGDMNLQMHELVQQQDVLFEQQEYVRALTEMAREMGIASGSHSQDATMMTGALGPLRSNPSDTAAFAETLMAMQEETRSALVSLSDAATLSTNEIVDQLRGIGIDTSAVSSAVGGPFIPADGNDISIIDEANAVADALKRYQAARGALLAAPIKAPVAGGLNTTSNFGTRTDPFLKRAAFHSGMDFSATSGSPVLAAANGTVVFAGSNGGYGNMIEIDHGNGLKTRYAHLSRILVSKGDTIDGGERIGLVGSTGRSTGPHLHFEVRRDGNAINPASFIAAGRELLAYL